MMIIIIIIFSVKHYGRMTNEFGEVYSSPLLTRTKSDFSSKTYETLRTFAPFKNSSFPDDASIAKLGDASVVKSDSGIPITLIRPKGESDKPSFFFFFFFGLPNFFSSHPFLPSPSSSSRVWSIW